MFASNAARKKKLPLDLAMPSIRSARCSSSLFTHEGHWPEAKNDKALRMYDAQTSSFAESKVTTLALSQFIRSAKLTPAECAASIDREPPSEVF